MTYSKPNVSIILTSYNHEKFIRESIESALNQTYTNFELIIWDDASNDNSWNIINNYSDPRIKKFRNKENQQGGIIKCAIQEVAIGEYIAILHSDDAWELNKLEKQVDFLDSHPEIAAVFTHVQVVNEEGHPFTNKNHPYYNVFEQPNRTRYEWLNFFFNHGNALCHPSMLIRKEIYSDVMYRKGLAQLPDFDLWIQLCLKYEIYIIQEKLTRFRVRDNEANVSGDHRISRVRGQFEFYTILEHYKTIASIDELVKIFPEAKKYTTQSNPDILYTLGRVAIEKGLFKPINLWGLNLLFDAINDPVRAIRLKNFYLFDDKSFKNLTAENDIFSVEVLRNLRNKLNDSIKLNKKLTTNLAEKNRILALRDKSIDKLKTDLAQRNQSIKILTSQLNNSNKAVQNLTSQLEDHKKIKQNLTSQIRERDKDIQNFINQLQESEQEILYYVHSKSWRITRPLRKFMKLLTRK